MELANIVVVAPGGVGTTLELFYTWQLLQVKMIRDIPIILLGDMWRDFLSWITKWPLQHQFLKQKDVNLLYLAKNWSEAFEIIKKTHNEFKAHIA
jgi:predicted Rossmann-fold nucleotide-binding protein